MKKIGIGLILGSSSDLPAFEEAFSRLREFCIPYELHILSAHRSPKLLQKELQRMDPRVKVFVAAAGGAAHLAGVIASHTLKPVIGVPMNSTLKGVDSFVSMSQMPAGVPVATMSIGKAGATNSVLLAAQILALQDQSLLRHLQAHRRSLVQGVRKAGQALCKTPQRKKSHRKPAA